MNVQQRKDLLARLGDYIAGNDEAWLHAQERASEANRWFTSEFIQLSAQNIARSFLQPQQLQELIDRYRIPDTQPLMRKVGIVMAGNIPLVGFHDLMCVFLSGHQALIKPSSRDEVMIKHLVNKLAEWAPEAAQHASVQDLLRNCDAYIATGSNNSARYFEHYFGKYPSIIRRNRTSVALLRGDESPETLSLLADDVYQYFGLGCRNVTQIYVPKDYDFIPLLKAFSRYDYLANHNKYKNNYDYNLAAHLLNKRYFMSNESLLLVEDPSPFSAIAQLHYQFYEDPAPILERLRKSDDIQCVVSSEDLPFGSAQVPEADDFADGVDTLSFLLNLK